MNRVFVAACGVIALIYLLNPTAGIFELIPDNLPVVGNLDEATATVVLIAALRYFGLDPSRLFMDRERNEPKKDK